MVHEFVTMALSGQQCRNVLCLISKCHAASAELTFTWMADYIDVLDLLLSWNFLDLCYIVN